MALKLVHIECETWHDKPRVIELLEKGIPKELPQYFQRGDKAGVWLPLAAENPGAWCDMYSFSLEGDEEVAASFKKAFLEYRVQWAAERTERWALILPPKVYEKLMADIKEAELPDGHICALLREYMPPAFRP